MGFVELRSLGSDRTGRNRDCSPLAMLSCPFQGYESQAIGVLAKNRQFWWLGASHALAWAARRGGFGIFPDLLWSLEVLLVAPIVVVLTRFGRIVATDLRPRLVDTTAVIVLQMLAGGMYQQVPNVFVQKNGSTIVQQIPPDELEIGKLGGCFDRQREVAAALGGAVFAQVLVRSKIFSANLFLDHFGHPRRIGGIGKM